MAYILQAASSVLAMLVLYWLSGVMYECSQIFSYALAILSLYSVWRHCRTDFNRYLTASVAIAWAVVAGLTVARTLYRNAVFRSRLSTSRARIEVFSNEDDLGTCTIKVQVPVHRGWKVQPGQYVLLGVPSASRLALMPHPFMVCYWDADGEDQANSVEFLIAPKRGLTRDLTRFNYPSTTSTWIDGPYGGMCGDLSLYSTVVLVASGMGIAAQMPYIKEIVYRCRQRELPTQDLFVLWDADEHCM